MRQNQFMDPAAFGKSVERLMEKAPFAAHLEVQAKSEKNRPSYVERAYDHVRNRIVDFSLKPGEGVTDAGIATELEISRTPVREAMRRLEREGLLRHTPHRGWRVRTLRVSDIEEIFELKECLETLLIRQATGYIPEEKRASLVDVVARMEAAADRKDRQAWLEADANFHDALYALARNERARQILSSINAQWRCMQSGLMAMEERMRHSAAEHRAILDRVLAGDAANAERLLCEQIARTKQYLVSLLNDLVLPFMPIEEQLR